MGIVTTILLHIGIIFGALIGAYVVFMLIMAPGPRKPVPEQLLEKTKQPPQETGAKRSA